MMIHSCVYLHMQLLKTCRLALNPYTEGKHFFLADTNYLVLTILLQTEVAQAMQWLSGLNGVFVPVLH
jgi:hypothetical protein